MSHWNRALEHQQNPHPFVVKCQRPLKCRKGVQLKIMLHALIIPKDNITQMCQVYELIQQMALLYHQPHKYQVNVV